MSTLWSIHLAQKTMLKNICHAVEICAYFHIDFFYVMPYNADKLKGEHKTKKPWQAVAAANQGTTQKTNQSTKSIYLIGGLHYVTQKQFCQENFQKGNLC